MNNKRRENGNELYRQKFNEFGLSEAFDFLGRDWDSSHGHKVLVKCKACGTEFSTWNVKSIFRGKIKKLCCQNCGATSGGGFVWNRSQKCREAVDYYMGGHSVKETAEAFDVSIGQISNAIQSRGASNGRNCTERSETTKDESRKAQERKIADRLNLAGLDYVGGYTDKNGTVKIRCRKCGYIFERTTHYARHGNVSCGKCRHDDVVKARKERQEKRRQEREDERERKAKDKPIGLSYYQREREKKLDIAHTCKMCGREYTPRQYMDDANLKSFSDCGFCSVACRKKSARKKQSGTKSIRHRARKFGCEFDSSVTLKKLIERNGLKCGICGGMCDPNDHGWTEYFGATSPTIDHIIPLSKGGSHTWDNVQVAHAICNSCKKDDLDEGVSVNDAS